MWDDQGTQYLDLYGGHAVISIGHSHPHYVERLTDQLNQVGFYSNSVHMPLQEELATKLGKLSGKEDYQLFLVNSGAEANENALKLASFVNGRKKIIAFKKGFRQNFPGSWPLQTTRLSWRLLTRTPISSFTPLMIKPHWKPVSGTGQRDLFGDHQEGIQGVGGINVATPEFLKKIRALCTEYGAIYIADGIQCGYGRSGKFFSHDFAGVNADIYSMAKGIDMISYRRHFDCPIDPSKALYARHHFRW